MIYIYIYIYIYDIDDLYHIYMNVRELGRNVPVVVIASRQPVSFYHLFE